MDIINKNPELSDKNLFNEVLNTSKFIDSKLVLEGKDSFILYPKETKEKINRSALEYLKRLGILNFTFYDDLVEPQIFEREMGYPPKIALQNILEKLAIEVNRALFLNFYKRIKKLDLNTDQSQKKIKLSYDGISNSLFVGDTKIKIQYGSIQADILATIFDNPKKKWDKEEILEKLHEDSDEIYDKNYKLKSSYRNQIYNACDKLKSKIAIKTGLSDVLEYNTQSVNINPKYVG